MVGKAWGTAAAALGRAAAPCAFTMCTKTFVLLQNPHIAPAARKPASAHAGSPRTPRCAARAQGQPPAELRAPPQRCQAGHQLFPPVHRLRRRLQCRHAPGLPPAHVAACMTLSQKLHAESMAPEMSTTTRNLLFDTVDDGSQRGTLGYLSQASMQDRSRSSPRLCIAWEQ